MFVWDGFGVFFGISVVDAGVEVKVGGLVLGRVIDVHVVIGARAVGSIHTSVVDSGL